MLSAVEGEAFGELADLAGANAAEKRAVAWSRTFPGNKFVHEEQRMDSAADSASVGLSTSRTSAFQYLSATWTGSHFPG